MLTKMFIQVMVVNRNKFVKLRLEQIKNMDQADTP